MSLPLCPTGCTSNLPGWSFSDCSPEINNGEIAKIYFTTVGNPLSDWTNELEWDSRLDNTATGASKIRVLTVVGELPAVGDNEKDISGGRKVEGVKDFLLNFEVDETGIDNYNALRAMECNSGNHLIWFETRDGLLFGGNDGIEAKIKLKLQIPKSYNDIMMFPGTAKWKARFSPERIDSPITSTTGNQ
jgi:hypothetical protein